MDKNTVVTFRLEDWKKERLREIAQAEGFEYRGQVSVSALIQDVLEEVLNKRQYAV
jgi:hypothetical protein